jgi:deazaflavin-dependent oxidoreductase (nitroreductase family)
VTAQVTPPTDRHEKRPLLGLRKKPGRLALALMHMPLRAYAHEQGHLLGHTFLQFTHVGRKSGKEYRSVAMALDYHDGTHEAVICAAWDTDWYRNLQAHPATNVKIDRLSFTPVQRFVNDDEALKVLLKFRDAHRHRVRLMSRILGWGNLNDDTTVREFISTHPFIAFRPQPVT